MTGVERGGAPLVSRPAAWSLSGPSRTARACSIALHATTGALPALASERLSLAEDGVVYALRRHWKDGTRAVMFDPLDFIARLAAGPRPSPRPACRPSSSSQGSRRSTALAQRAPACAFVDGGENLALPQVPEEPGTPPSKPYPWAQAPCHLAAAGAADPCAQGALPGCHALGTAIPELCGEVPEKALIQSRGFAQGEVGPSPKEVRSTEGASHEIVLAHAGCRSRSHFFVYLGQVLRIQLH